MAGGNSGLFLFIINLMKYILSCLFLICAITPSDLFATNEYILTIKNHYFIPETIKVPANKKIKLVVYNQDSEIEEFESFDLYREKLIPPNGKIKINIGPLAPGEYKFFGEFHQKTANGTLIAE